MYPEVLHVPPGEIELRTDGGLLLSGQPCVHEGLPGTVALLWLFHEHSNHQVFGLLRQCHPGRTYIGYGIPW